MAAPVGAIRVEVSAGTAKFEAGMKKARNAARANGIKIEKSFRGIRKSSMRASSALKAFGPSLAGIAGATAFLGFMRKSVRAFVDLERGIREVGTLMGGLSKKQMAAMTKELKALAAATGQSIDKLVKAKYDIVSAGFADAASSAELLAVATQLAVGGVTDVATAADLLTTAVNAYGVGAEGASEISDKLFTIVRLGKTTVNELAGSMGRLLAISATMGVGIDEVGAALAALTATGQGTEEAVTAIRAAIVEFSKPSKDLADALRSIGIESGEALIKEKGLKGALDAVSEAAEKNNTTIVQLLSNVRSMQAILPLATTAADKFAAGLVDMAGAVGATGAAFGEMTKTADFQFKQLSALWQNTLIKMGEAITPFALSVTKGLNAMLGGTQREMNQLATNIKFLEAGLADLEKQGKKDTEQFRNVQIQLAGAQVALFDMTGETAKAGAALTLLNQLIAGELNISLEDLQRQLEGATAQTVGLSEEGIRPATTMTTAFAGEIRKARLEIDAFADAEARAKQEAEDLFSKRVSDARNAAGMLNQIGSNLLAAEKSRIQERLEAELKPILEVLKLERSKALALSKIRAADIDAIRASKRTEEEKARAIAEIREADIEATNNLRESEETAAATISNLREQAVIDAREAAKKVKKIRLAAVAIETAVNIVEAYPNPVLVALAFAVGATQIAAINAQAFAKGAAFSGGQAFASGGVVTKPTLFPMAQGAGLMGEAGPEAIMPLKRTSTGDLGVQATGGGSSLTLIFSGPISDEDYIRETVVPIIVDQSRKFENDIVLNA